VGWAAIGWLAGIDFSLLLFDDKRLMRFERRETERILLIGVLRLRTMMINVLQPGLAS
jgi:hypothetical protein